MSTGFRRWGNDWGLLLISNFVFISVTFCINPYCVFRFLGLFMYVFQYWSPGILSSFSCSSTAFSSINSCVGLLSVMKVIASVGVVFTAPVISLRAWFWACSSTLSVCVSAVTRDSQLYIIIGRMYFCTWCLRLTRHIPTYFRPSVSGHLCAWKLARRCYPRGFSNLTCCQRSHQGTWIHLFGREQYLYTSTLDAFFFVS